MKILVLVILIERLTEKLLNEAFLDTSHWYIPFGRRYLSQRCPLFSILHFSTNHYHETINEISRFSRIAHLRGNRSWNADFRTKGFVFGWHKFLS